MAVIYTIGVIGIVASVICQSLGYPLGAEIAITQVQAIWAKVLMLACVVVFIQWEPLGLFPPKGRLADA